MNRLVAQAASLQYRRLPVGGAWNKTQAPHPASVQQVSNQLCSARKTPAAFCLSLLARNERGESRREGKLIRSASSPRPSPPFVRRRGRENAAARSKQIFCRTQLVSNLRNSRLGSLRYFPNAVHGPNARHKSREGFPFRIAWTRK